MAMAGRQVTGRRRRGMIGHPDRQRNSQNPSPSITAGGNRNSTNNIVSRMGNTRNNSSGYLFHTCCVMLTVFAFAGADIHHRAAFVTRLGGNSVKKLTESSSDVSSKNNCGKMMSSSPSSLSCMEYISSSSTKKQPLLLSTSSRRTFNRLGSLWMAPRSSSDTEMQLDGASDVEDENEWRNILASFQMYKAAYGDLKVPSRFVVPAMAPWPGELDSNL